MIFLKLNDEADLHALSIHLSGLVVKEEVSIVDNRPGEESIDNELGTFKVNEDLHHSFFDHLNCVHRITGLEYELSHVILLRFHSVDELIDDQARDAFLQEIDLLKHCSNVQLCLIVVTLH